MSANPAGSSGSHCTTRANNRCSPAWHESWLVPKLIFLLNPLGKYHQTTTQQLARLATNKQHLFLHHRATDLFQYQTIHLQLTRSYNSICREEENLVFCFGALFNSTLNFTQSGWLIPFSPDLHFRLAKRVSGQTHPLRLETATRTDVSLVAPA